ncbi:MAG TPA: S8 family serine peptidase [Blastocatellia bacterium]|nr:S8 family serine peptidase [Blastocatellia bacterium]
MKISRLLRVIIFAAVITGIAMLPGFTSSAQQSGIASVIVELRDEPAALPAARAEQSGTPLTDDQLQAYRNNLRAAQDQFLNALRSRGISFQVQTFNIKDASGNVAATPELRYTLVFNGITLKVPLAAIPLIESLPQVKKVHSNSSLCVNLDKSVPYIRAPEVYGQIAELTQFDDFREGYEGQGINVAVIDTGIDWPHEMFGGDPTPPRLAVQPTVAAVNTNKKVIYSLPMADIVTDGFGHGTHVASTIAGYLGFAPGADGLPMTADDIRLHGVAPQAKLMSYKVCSDSLSTVGAVGGPVGGCLTSNIVMAIEDAVSPRTLDGLPKPVAHVINMSLGGGGGPDNPTSVASDNAVLLGCTVVAAAGNSGPGEGTLGAPAAGRRVIAVAADTDPGSNAGYSADVLNPSSVNRNLTGAVTPASNLPLAAGQRSQIRLFPMAGTPAPPQGSMAQYYVFVRNGQTIDEWPASVRGRIALVKLTDPKIPQTLFAQVANNGAAAGAVAVIFVSSTQNPTAVRSTIPAANIMPADGEYLIDLISSTDDNNVDPANGTISEFPIRLNPFFGTSFVGEMANFSSRGPVQGFGQVKPDVSAPGVNVLAAMPPASVLGALAGGNYGAISGTSMATPHVAGAAALVKQAHPGWNPDMIRTALINTATNLRNENQMPKADGLANDSIIDMGGGLIDVFEAVNAKALMGVAGDGINAPSILGSHSFGEVPVVNNRVTSSQSVTVTIKDLSGQGGTYNLNVVNNRDLQLNGIGVSVSPTSVTVPANGSATFTVNATFDGNLIRDVMAAKVINNQVVFERIQMQWYVTATRADGAESLRMPFYFRPTFSVPAAGNTVTDAPRAGTIIAGDANSQTAAGVTYQDFTIPVSDTTTKLEASLEFMELVDDNVADLDMFLFDPSGAQIASSTNPGGPEFISTPISRGGNYRIRVTGFLGGPTNFTLNVTHFRGNTLPPALQTIAGDFVDAQGRQVDFDGNVTIQWTPRGGEQGFEVEQSTDNQAWQIVADVSGSTSSYAFNALANGQYFFRVRAMYPGQIGLFVSNPSNVASVLVDQRAKQEITNLVKNSISNVSLTDGVFQLDLAMTNQSSNTYVPLVEFKIVSISSGSGTVRVINADNSGDGTSAATAALFDYSRQLGSDEQFSPNEVSGKRTMRFQDNASELFTFTSVVTGYARTGGASGGGTSTPDGGGGAGSASGSATSLAGLTQMLRFTVNPLTKTVVVDLVKINP